MSPLPSKEGELRLLESKRQLDLLINKLQGVAYRAEALPPWRILFVSQGIERLTGYDVAEFEQGKRFWSSIIHPDDYEAIALQVREAIAERRSFAFSYRIFHRSGEVRWMRERGEAVFDERGQPVFLEGLISDITDLVRSQSALREAKELFERVIDSTPDGVFLKNYQDGGRYVLVNRALLRLTKLPAEKLIGHTDEEIFSPDVAADYRQQDLSFVQGKSSGMTLEQTSTTDRGELLLEVRKFPIRNEEGKLHYVLGILRDLTEQRALEQKVQKMQRMDAVGQLTGGIAHDFNNLLAVVLGYGELLRDHLTDPYLISLTDKVLNASERGADLVRRLMVFARKHRLEPHVMNLNQSLPGLVDLLSRTLGEHIRIELHLDPDLWPVKVDPSQVDDAIVNLTLNARDAMPDGGVVIIETANVSLDQETANRLVDAQPGDYAMLAVKDSGHGMTEDVLTRVFEPFFTTKDQGRGTGLGLPMVYGFVSQSGGHVIVESAVGQGAKISLFLPRATEAGETLETEPRPSEIAGGHETVLLVEDNDSVRAMAAMHLRKLGYRVLEASSGVEALALLHKGVKPELLFTDIMMQEGVSGYDLAVQARAMLPDLPILFTTGYDSPAIKRPHEHLPDAELLYKPYRREGLALAIRKVLDHARIGTR